MLDISICWTLIFRPKVVPIQPKLRLVQPSILAQIDVVAPPMASSGGFPWVFSRFPIQNSQRSNRGSAMKACATMGLWQHSIGLLAEAQAAKVTLDTACFSASD